MSRKGNLPSFCGYLVFRGLQQLLRILPEGVSFAAARALGRLWYRLDGRHRRMARANIARVHRWSVDDPRTKELARASFSHTVQVAAEFLLLPPDLEGRDGKPVVELADLEKVRPLIDSGRGMIFVTGHTGNWEILGASFSSRVAPLSVVYRELDNLHIERYTRRRRESFDQTMIGKKGALSAAARVLKRGGNLALLLDQHGGESEPVLDFLGHPAHTFSTAGVLSVRFQVPVVVGFCYRIGKGMVFRMYFDDPVLPLSGGSESDEVMRITRAVNGSIERFVQAHPEQWLWMHRRWIASRKRPDRDRDKPVRGRDEPDRDDGARGR